MDTNKEPFEIIPRKVIPLHSTQDKASFRVMQWNTLADSLHDAFPFVDSKCILYHFFRNFPRFKMALSISSDNSRNQTT
jgi:hypothetical protein